MSGDMIDEKTRMRAGVVAVFKKTMPEFDLYSRVTLPQASALMKKNESTLKRALARGDIKAIRDEGRIYFLGYQVADWYLEGMKPEWNGVERRVSAQNYAGKERRRVQVSGS